MLRFVILHLGTLQYGSVSLSGTDQLKMKWTNKTEWPCSLPFRQNWPETPKNNCLKTTDSGSWEVCCTCLPSQDRLIYTNQKTYAYLVRGKKRWSVALDMEPNHFWTFSFSLDLIEHGCKSHLLKKEITRCGLAAKVCMDTRVSEWMECKGLNKQRKSVKF